MAGSEAEERIRGKVEAALHRRRPDARIIHELVLRQGGVRIDMAAVWPDGMILAEIKSERDTLNRLEPQLKAALDLGGEVWLCLAEKWRPKVEALKHRCDWRNEDVVRKCVVVGRRSIPIPNTDYLPCLEARDLHIRYETDEGLEPLSPYISHHGPHVMTAELLHMLWADELRQFAAGSSRHPCMLWARENMSGRAIRQAVCDALLRRPFPRADAPIEGRSPRSLLFAAPETSPPATLDPAWGATA